MCGAAIWVNCKPIKLAVAVHIEWHMIVSCDSPILPKSNAVFVIEATPGRLKAGSPLRIERAPYGRRRVRQVTIAVRNGWADSIGNCDKKPTRRGRPITRYGLVFWHRIRTG